MFGTIDVFCSTTEAVLVTTLHKAYDSPKKLLGVLSLGVLPHCCRHEDGVQWAICMVKKVGGSEKKIPVGSACHEDRRVWKKYFSNSMTWQVFCEKVRTCSQMQAIVASIRQCEEDPNQKTIPDENVKETQQNQITVSRTWVIVNSDELRKLMGTRTLPKKVTEQLPFIKLPADTLIQGKADTKDPKDTDEDGEVCFFVP